jgi:preprotein translocase subunit SecY
MSLTELKAKIAAKHEEAYSEVAPKIKAIAQKHGLDDAGIVEGVIQFVVIAVLVVFIPGILYVVSSGTVTIPANTTYSLIQSNVSTNVGNGVSTVGVIPTIFAIVLIIGVLMLLAMRR